MLNKLKEWFMNVDKIDDVNLDSNLHRANLDLVKLQANFSPKEVKELKSNNHEDDSCDSGSRSCGCGN